MRIFMKTLTCGFIGLGLIGGSIARALKKYDYNIKVIAYDVNRDALSAAVSAGIADSTTRQIDDTFSNCDYLFLCAPVQKNDSNLAAVKKIISSSCILTDVGSVKTTIHEAVRAAGLENQFIGGHPMAGSERVGFVNSRASLLENAYYILTPSPGISSGQVDAFKTLITGMGAIPLVLDYKQHDYVTAAVSHLPHVIASSLVHLVEDSDSKDGIMKMIAAGGFKDITRIASSSAAMWQQICLTNTENIVALLDSYMDALGKIRTELVNRESDAIYDFFDGARIYRDSFINASSGPIKRAYCIHVDIADKAGALAHIVTMLAGNNISIKNVEITHNRESEDGVLRVEFYEEGSMNAAIELLQKEDYHLYLLG